MCATTVLSLLIFNLFTAESKNVASLCPPRLLKTVDSDYLQTLNGSCFHFVFSTRKTYSEASKDCMKDGGTLALPNSKPLNDFLADQMLNHYGTSEQAWIGLYNKKNETKFVWDDNSELEWHNFAKGHGPGNDWLSAGIEDCAAMDPKDDGLWYDYQCDSTSWANVFNPQKIFICQYTLGVTRTVDNSCPPGVLSATGSQSKFLQIWNKICFRFVISKRRTYNRANKDCMKDGGTLALPKTKPLNDFLADQLLNNYGKSEEAWIGLHDKKEETKFVWEDNSDLDWHNFAKGNGPDNDWLARGIEDCAAIDPGDQGVWYDFQCDSNLTWATRSNPSKIYICQYSFYDENDLPVTDPSLDKIKDVTRSIDSTCPPGVLNSIGPHFLQVFNETCFHFVLYKWVSYGEASKDCSKFGGTLALPKTKPLNDYLTDQLLNHYDISEDVWIGLHDKKEDTKFVWEDNSDLEWHNFAKRSGLNNPWLISGNEDCVALDPGDEGQWYDYQCDSDLFSWATRSNPKKSYICQYKLGVNSGVQLQGKYRDPSLNKVKDPSMFGRVRDTCPPGVIDAIGPYFLHAWNEICFHFGVSSRKTYSEASMECAKGGGTLAMPKTKPLNDYLTDQLLNHYDVYEEAWIGLSDKKEETKFVWVDNSDLKWHNFAKGNGPDNDWLSAGVEDCVVTDPREQGLWYDYQCDSNLLSWATSSNPRYFYICQYIQDVNRTIDNTCPPKVLKTANPHFLQVWNKDCFRFITSRRRTYNKANKDCMKHGGTLAMPKTKPLNDFLADQLFNNYGKKEEAWIGLHDKKEETKFVWEDNSDLVWHNFAKGSGPDNDWLIRGVEDCVALTPGGQGLWNDYQCDSNFLSWITQSRPEKIYICQYTLNMHDK